MNHILMLLLTVFISVAPFSANAYTLEKRIDFVTFDLPGVEEPSGDGTIVIDIPDEIALKTDPLTLQQLVDEAMKIADEGEAILTRAAKETKKSADSLMGMLKRSEKEQIYAKQELATLVKHLEKTYTDVIARTEENMKAAVEAKWQELGKQNKDLLKYKIKTSVSVAAGAFKVAQGIAEAVASGGTNVFAYVKIIKGIIKMYTGISNLFASESTTRAELGKAISDAKQKLDTKIAGKKGNALLNAVDAWLYKEEGTALKGTVNVYVMKLIGIRQDAQKLAKELNTLLTQQNAAINIADEKLKTQYEESIKNALATIEELNVTLDGGKYMVEYAKKLQFFMNEANKTAFTPKDLAEEMMRTTTAAQPEKQNSMKDKLKVTKKALEALEKEFDLKAKAEATLK